jgi:hypothetical protein
MEEKVWSRRPGVLLAWQTTVGEMANFPETTSILKVTQGAFLGTR